MPTLDQRWLPLNIPRCALTQKARAGIAREGREFTGLLSHKKPGLCSREDAVKRRPRFQPGPGARKRHPGKKVLTTRQAKTSLLTFSIPHRPSMPKSKFIDLLPLRSCRFSTDRWRPHTVQKLPFGRKFYIASSTFFHRRHCQRASRLNVSCPRTFLSAFSIQFFRRPKTGPS